MCTTDERTDGHHYDNTPSDNRGRRGGKKHVLITKKHMVLFIFSICCTLIGWFALRDYQTGERCCKQISSFFLNLTALNTDIGMKFSIFRIARN